MWKMMYALTWLYFITEQSVTVAEKFIFQKVPWSPVWGSCEKTTVR